MRCTNRELTESSSYENGPQFTGERIRLAKETFGERLPAQCPPENAKSGALNNVYRLVPVAQPDSSSFDSKLALGNEKPPHFKASDCEWASCSLSISVDSLLKIAGLRKRNKYVAKLSIPADKGRHLTEGTHIHFWRFSNFDLASAVETVAEHGR